MTKCERARVVSAANALRYSITIVFGSKSGAGYCGSIRSSVRTIVCSIDEIARPFAIRGHDVPRRVIRRALVEDRFIGGLVLVPKRALLQVARVELPELARIVQSRFESFLLFVLRNVEEEFQQTYAVAS